MHENTEIRREAVCNSYFNNCLSSTKSGTRHIVVPAGVNFFHITEHATGQVKGFRCRHVDACELARTLER
ncbi:hypothetical protein H8F21_28685 [Pseudomonas sp. P66]|jgi:hypothetical protein|uniref:Uncharacterized protein n=1 Tax=Pseudomonas arcuscaelestis TaxID=2710591 RepID=A0ABS2C6N1_9PSED|nr:hypothetical protein [Pseudomonas arcuscaelestis]MBM3108771.1 hypothetical protein [Pseudomonas arcuscaelestis]MBM3114098.1 hypothetical protein [Pseudomonas arcuscaelestis]MBM5461538.1 hypothetical protein [Pseudomonas arcuscaelestis]